jgi:hypothetical protein
MTTNLSSQSIKSIKQSTKWLPKTTINTLSTDQSTKCSILRQKLPNRLTNQPTVHSADQAIKHCALWYILQHFAARGRSIATQSEVSSCTVGRFFRECKSQKDVGFNSIFQSRLSVGVCSAKRAALRSKSHIGRGGGMLHWRECRNFLRAYGPCSHYLPARFLATNITSTPLLTDCQVRMDHTLCLPYTIRY